MKKIIVQLLLITSLVFGCSSTKTPEHIESNKSNSVLTEEESMRLKHISLTNEFLSGCVTYELSVIADELCDDSTKDCLEVAANRLNYNQWLKIYNACIVNP